MENSENDISQRLINKRMAQKTDPMALLLVLAMVGFFFIVVNVKNIETNQLTLYTIIGLIMIFVAVGVGIGKKR